MVMMERVLGYHADGSLSVYRRSQESRVITITIDETCTVDIVVVTTTDTADGHALIQNTDLLGVRRGQLLL